MLYRIILNYIRGYVRISVDGYFVQRFINMCISKKILLFNIKRIKSTIIFADICINDFRRMRNISKRTKCKIRIVKRKGLPFILKKYKKRKLFMFLLLMIVTIILIFSQYIWNIEIINDENINEEEIIMELKKNAFEVGKLKKNIDTKNIINRIRLERKDIAWMGIEFKGTNAIIKIVSAKEKPEIINEDEYCNIISDKTGKILKINVQNGTALVKEGDIVNEGTPLVGGFLEGKYTGARYVHSIADIEAIIWHSKKEKFYFTQETITETGNTEEKYGININNFKINLYKTLSKFQNYDTIKETKKIAICKNFYLPIEILKFTNKELKKEKITYGNNELKILAIKKIENELEREILDKSNIVNKQINFKEEKDFIEVEVILEVKEEIGIKEKIVF